MEVAIIPNYHGHWNDIKIEFGMILVVIWYEYHTLIFAVYDGMHASIV